MITILQANPYDSMSGGEAAGLMAMSGGMIIFALLAYAFSVIAFTKFFKKQV